LVFKDTTAKDFVTALKGKKVVDVKRWGKYFWFSDFHQAALISGFKWNLLRIQCYISVRLIAFLMLSLNEKE